MSSKPSMDGNRQTLESSVSEFCDSLAARAKSLSECAKRLRRVRSLALISQQLAEVTGAVSDVAKLNEEVQRLVQQCAEASDRGFLEVDSQLREICAKRGWKMDGQWPDFIVDYGVSVHIDEAKHVLNIGGTAVPLDNLETALTEHTVRLIPKKFSPDQFMRKIVEAYDASPMAKSHNIPILELYRELVILMQSARFWRDASSNSFNPLTIAQFRAQFSRMLEAGVSAAPDGRELQLLPPLDPKDAIFMYQPAERRFGFVGRVELRHT